MQAAYLVKPGTIEIRQVPAPDVGPGDLLVRVTCATTCGTDLKAYRRGHRLIPMPGRFGHEFAGVIAEVGRDVAAWKPGQRVTGVQSASCGQCRMCQHGRENLCEDLVHLWGMFAEYVLLPARHHQVSLIAAETDVPDAELALVEPLACVVHGLNVLGSVQDNETVLVLGAGAIGLMQVQLLRTRHDCRIVVAGKHAARLALARQLGADAAVDIAGAGADEALDEALRGETADVLIECVGRPDAWQEAVRRTGPGGRTLLFGGCPAGTEFAVDAGRLHYGERQLLGAFHFTPREVRVAYALIVQKKVKLAPLISGELPLADLQKALDAMAQGKGIKYALCPSAEAQP